MFLCPYITEATSDIEQAKRWAKRTTQRVKQKQSYVFVYEISNRRLLGIPPTISRKPVHRH